MNLEASLSEKFQINIYTPMDKLGIFLPKQILEQITKPHGISPDCVNNTVAKKNKSYKFLINKLYDNNLPEKRRNSLLDIYSKTPCGRLQLKTAYKRNLLSENEYNHYYTNKKLLFFE